MAGIENLAGGIVAVGIGGAAAAGIEPVLEPARQQAWKESLAKVLEIDQLAELVASGVISKEDADAEAARTGYHYNRVSALVQLALEAPSVAEALDLRRRDKITAEQLQHALVKAKIEPQYWPALTDLVDERLSPQVVALAIVRGIIADPGFLPVGPPTAEGKIPAFPTSKIDAVDEAASSGYNRERLFVETAIMGRPMGPESAAAAVFRDILERVDYDRAIAEGDVRNEWADAIFETARQIPSVSDYVNAHIRGWIDRAAMHEGAARHGMSPADVDLLYLRTGRPAAPGQMATAAARGIDGPDKTPMDRAQFLKGIAESDIRPEWGPMLWESRYLYPPLFQLTRLVQGGAIDSDTAARWAEYDRYPPEVVTALKTYWDAPTAAKADTHIGKAQTQLWTTTHRSYLAAESDDATATAALEAAGVAPASVPNVLTLWGHERDLIRKQLTPSQIKKAFTKVETNPATGASWTRDDALEALVQRGYSVNDANSLLDL